MAFTYIPKKNNDKKSGGFNVTKAKKNLGSRLTAAGYDLPSTEKPNFLLDILDVLSRTGYAANNTVKQIVKPDPTKNVFSAFGRGISGEERTEGAEIFQSVGLKDPLLSSIAGFALDVLNPLDPLNYIGLGTVSDVAKGSIKGSGLLAKAFGDDTAAKIVKVLGNKVDDIGAGTVGELYGKVSKVAKDTSNTALADVRKALKMSEGVSETSETVAKGVRSYDDVRTLMNDAMKAGDIKPDIKLPYRERKYLSIGFNQPAFGTPKKFHKIPGSWILADPVSKGLRAIGKTRVGNVLGKAFNTKFTPGSVPDQVIVKHLDRLGKKPVDDVVNEMMDDLVQTGAISMESGKEVYQQVRDELTTLFHKIKSKEDDFITEVSEMFKKIPQAERELVTEVVAKNSNEIYDSLSEPAKLAVDEFRNWRDGILQEYQRMGVNIEGLDDYVPFIPKRPLSKSEKGMMQSTFDTRVADDADDLLSRFDPNLRERRYEYEGASPADINKLLSKPWLREDAAELMAIRGVRAIRGQEVAQFMNDFVDQFGMVPDEIRKVLDGNIPKGYTAFVMKRSDSGKTYLLKIDTEQMINKTGTEKVMFLPEEIANVYNQYADIVFGDDKKNALLKLFDSVTTMYKKFAYLWNPGHIPRDIIGNIWNGYLMGLKNPKRYKQAIDVLTAAEKGEELIIKIGDRTFDAAKLTADARKAGILDIGGSVAETPASVVAQLKVDRTKENIFKRAGRGYSNAMRAGTRWGDATSRMAGLIDQLSKGKTFKQAVDQVRKYYFDYFDLTPFERKYMKRIFPFYTWMRKNIPLQITELLKQTWDEKPEYLRDLIAFTIGDTGVSGSMSLPYQDLNKLPITWENMQALLANTNPVVRAPLELITNLQMFTGRNIEEYPGEMRDTPFSGLLKRLGVQEVPRVEKRGLAYLVDQIPLLNSLNIVADPENARNTSRLVSMIGGPSFYDNEAASESKEYEDYKIFENFVKKLRDEGVELPTLDEIKKKRK
jgi:polyhydroxyalkanoate synthesis regulator phasin